MPKDLEIGLSDFDRLIEKQIDLQQKELVIKNLQDLLKISITENQKTKRDYAVLEGVYAGVCTQMEKLNRELKELTECLTMAKSNNRKRINCPLCKMDEPQLRIRNDKSEPL